MMRDQLREKQFLITEALEKGVDFALSPLKIEEISNFSSHLVHNPS